MPEPRPCDGCKHLHEHGYCTVASSGGQQFPDFSCKEMKDTKAMPQRPNRAFAFPENMTQCALAVPGVPGKVEPGGVIPGHKAQVTIFGYQNPIMVNGEKDLRELKWAIDYALGIEPSRDPK